MQLETHGARVPGADAETFRLMPEGAPEQARMPSEARRQEAAEVRDARRMDDVLAVFVARPFGPAEALSYTEGAMVGAGVPVASLEAVGDERFFPFFAGEVAGCE